MEWLLRIILWGSIPLFLILGMILSSFEPKKSG